MSMSYTPELLFINQDAQIEPRIVERLASIYCQTFAETRVGECFEEEEVSVRLRDELHKPYGYLIVVPDITGSIAGFMWGYALPKHELIDTILSTYFQTNSFTGDQVTQEQKEQIKRRLLSASYIKNLADNAFVNFTSEIGSPRSRRGFGISTEMLRVASHDRIHQTPALTVDISWSHTNFEMWKIMQGMGASVVTLDDVLPGEKRLFCVTDITQVANLTAMYPGMKLMRYITQNASE